MGNSKWSDISFKYLAYSLPVGCSVSREYAGELAPDPLNADRLRLNRLLHQTPDLPDRS